MSGTASGRKCELKNITNSTINRVFACIMASMVFFMVLFSTFFIVSHADHDCTGEECPVCACIQQCENILHSTGDGEAFATTEILPVILFSGFIFVSYCIVISDTPVSTKVRIND